MSIQLVVPMAGLGQRFQDAGYETAKPLLPIHGVPMISVVLSNLFDERLSQIVLITRPEVAGKKYLEHALLPFKDILKIVELDKLSMGPAESVLSSKHLLDPELPLVIANSDQYLNTDISSFYDTLGEGSDGEILCMRDNNPKWSYVTTNSENYVVDVVEKQVVSNLATVGVYGFRKSSLAVNALQEMISAGDKTNGEFYVAPCYPYLARRHYRIRAIDLGPVGEVMYGLGTPNDYEYFCQSPVSYIASRGAFTFPGSNSRLES